MDVAAEKFKLHCMLSVLFFTSFFHLALYLTKNKFHYTDCTTYISNITVCKRMTPYKVCFMELTLFWCCRHNVYKVERIPGSKHRLRKTKYKVMKVPGKTYALNRKNNEMCSVIFKQWFDVDHWHWLCLVRNGY